MRNHSCNGQIANPDRNRNRPTNWSQRHQLVLYMHIAGRRTKDIADALAYHPARVSAIIHSPLFEAKKAELLDELLGTTHDDLLEEIRREAIPNLEFLVGLRDDPAKHGGDVRVRLRAAKAIAEQVDRVLPKRGEELEDHTVQVNFDEATLRRMAAVMAEVRGETPPALDAEFEEIPPDTRLIEEGVGELKGRG